VISRAALLDTVGEERLARTEADARAEVAAAFEAALSDPMPEFSLDEACNPYSEAL
jgi:pyruvate dehydrogenase E1 component alpha subunit